MSTPLYAQDQNIQEVVVTGSRIAQPNLASPQLAAVSDAFRLVARSS